MKKKNKILFLIWILLGLSIGIYVAYITTEKGLFLDNIEEALHTKFRLWDMFIKHGMIIFAFWILGFIPYLVYVNYFLLCYISMSFSFTSALFLMLKGTTGLKVCVFYLLPCFIWLLFVSVQLIWKSFLFQGEVRKHFITQEKRKVYSLHLVISLGGIFISALLSYIFMPLFI